MLLSVGRLWGEVLEICKRNGFPSNDIYIT